MFLGVTYLDDPWGFYRLTKDEQIDLMAFHRVATAKQQKTKGKAKKSDPDAVAEVNKRIAAYRARVENGRSD